MALALFYDRNGLPQPVDVTDGAVHIHFLDENKDELTDSLRCIEAEHAEIHEGNSFAAYYVDVTAATNGHRSGIYIKTPASPRYCHMVASFSASTAAIFSICEEPTIAANTGTHNNVIYNRYRNSINSSLCQDNATAPNVGRFTTLNEAEIAGDGTWDVGTMIRTAPLEVGAGPRPDGGAGRLLQEWILKADTAYVFLLTNTTAEANTHHILLDWYSHTNGE